METTYWQFCRPLQEDSGCRTPRRASTSEQSEPSGRGSGALARGSKTSNNEHFQTILIHFPRYKLRALIRLVLGPLGLVMIKLFTQPALSMIDLIYQNPGCSGMYSTFDEIRDLCEPWCILFATTIYALISFPREDMITLTRPE